MGMAQPCTLASSDAPAARPAQRFVPWTTRSPVSIDRSACLRLRTRLATCRACATACPTQAIEAGERATLIAAKGEAIVQSIPLGRVGTPEDVAAVIVFLATVEPNYLTGEIIDVDGGQWVN